MPLPAPRDLERTREQLQVVVQHHLGDVLVSEVRVPEATGFSNDTVMFSAGDRQLVARIAPTGPAVFPTYDLASEFALLQQLARADVPVPATVFFEKDPAFLGAPFYVMAHVVGEIPGDSPPHTLEGWVLERTPGERRALWTSGIDTMARIHQVDVAGFDVATNGLDAQLEYYEHFLDWAARDRPQPITEVGLRWLRAHQPPEGPVHRLCWGDARPGNMIFRDGKCVAVLDWEMVALGNPVQDLAWWLFLQRHHTEGLFVEVPDGIPTRAETISRWEERTGYPTAEVDYYEVFAAFRFAVIMIRVAQLMVEYELLPPDSDFESNNIVTRLLDELLDQSE